MPDATSYVAGVGAQLRATRARRGLSLGALAAAARVGKGSLSEIENGSRNPTLATLYALANALDVPLATLLAERPGSEASSPGITARLIDIHRAEQTTVETYLLELTPGHTHRSGAHGAGVEEHLYLVTGRASVGPAAEPTVIAIGESASWRADSPHTYQALDDLPASGVLVIRTPQQP